MDAAVIAEILALALKVGVPAVQAVIAAMNKDTITLADVQALKGLVNAAETYFQANSSTAQTTTPATAW